MGIKAAPIDRLFHSRNGPSQLEGKTGEPPSPGKGHSEVIPEAQA